MNKPSVPAVPLVRFDPLTILRLLLAIVAASVVFLALNYGQNALLFGTDKEPVRQHLREAFASGALGLRDSRKDDADLGVHQINDCLIFDMAARDAEPSQFMRYLFMAQRTHEADERANGMCLRLRNWLFQDPEVETDFRWRTRYLYGFRAVAIGLLKLMPVPEARAAMKAASYGVFAILGLVALGFLFRRRYRGPDRAAAGAGAPRGLLTGGAEIAYLLLALSFLLLFGLPYFGQSISHAPSIVSMGLFLIAWAVLDLRRRLTLRRMLGLSILFGLLTAHFEFLTGYIPVGSALLVLLVSVAQTGEERYTPLDLLKLFFLTQGAFVGSIVIVYVLHLAAGAVGTPDGAQLVQSFFDYLGVRMSTTVEVAGEAASEVVIGPADVAVAFYNQLSSLAPISGLPGLSMLLGSFGLLLFGCAEVQLSAAPARWKARVFLAAFAVVPILVWLLAFQNHAVIHSRFMVRILVAVFAAAALMAYWLLKLHALGALQGRSTPLRMEAAAA